MRNEGSDDECYAYIYLFFPVLFISHFVLLSNLWEYSSHNRVVKYKKTYDRLLFINRLFWNDIHHLLGLPVPSAYNFSTSLAASS